MPNHDGFPEGGRASRRVAALAALLAAGLAGCGGGADDACTEGCDGPPGLQINMDFSLGGGFYAAPFPSESRRTPAGAIDVSTFPSPTHAAIEEKVLALLAKDAAGFGRTSGVFFSLTGELDPSNLPGYAASLATDAPVFLVGIDEAQPDYGKRYPISVEFAADGGPFGAPNLLSLLPLQGAPLRGDATYAAVVTTKVHGPAGEPLVASPSMAALAAGAQPAGLAGAAYEAYAGALATLASLGVGSSEIAGLAVFRTGDPLAGMKAVEDDVLAAPTPVASKPFELHEVFDDYCVYASTIAMPDYQGGTPPFTDDGGGWVFDASGKPQVQRHEEANFVVTVPRRTMPAAGFPLVVLSRTGAGGDRPLVDRGVQAVHNGPSIEPGTGPALYFARAGYAGTSIDGPHGGLRNVTAADEQFLMFNVSNPVALRDNVRQSAVELSLATHILAKTEIDVSACPGVTVPGGGPAKFDAGTMAVMGHSMGASISPLALAFEPNFRAALLSGSGGSYIENVVYKLSPLPVRGIAEVLLGISSTGYHLHEHDPLLSLLQWALEPSDTPVYGDRILREPVGAGPRHVLMMQGIVDTYILPAIANTCSLSLGLDLAGEELDSKSAALAKFTPLGTLLPLVGRGPIALPASGNVTVGGASVTAVVTQHPQDAIEDGHEVVFQTEAPKHEYQCFLSSLAKGTPTVPSAGGVSDPCP